VAENSSEKRCIHVPAFVRVRSQVFRADSIKKISLCGGYIDVVTENDIHQIWLPDINEEIYEELIEFLGAFDLRDTFSRPRKVQHDNPKT
jgi:hypothetical protein